MKKRARSDQDKLARRRAVLVAAHATWLRSGWEGFSMTEVARRARLAKGTLYLYFATKEALLLELLEGRLASCLAAFEARLAAEDAPDDPEGASRLIVSTLSMDSVLCSLLMVLGAVLEHNVPEARIHQFKRWLLERLAAVGVVLERRLPPLGEGGGLRLLLHLQALVVGLGQLAYPAPAVRRVLAQPGFEPFRIDFERELTFALSALIRGHSRERPIRRPSQRSHGERGHAL